MKLVEKNFLIYKLLNSSFTGLSIGIIFTIYEPIDPEVFSVGGMILAVSLLVVAKFYERLLDIKSFFWITLFVEAIMLLTIITFFALQYSLASALLIYCGYQITFMFGGYLVRAETLVANRKDLLSKIDVNKQVGYFIGLGASFLFYKACDALMNVSDLELLLEQLQASLETPSLLSHEIDVLQQEILEVVQQELESFKKEQISILHYFLILLQSLIIFIALRSFRVE